MDLPILFGWSFLTASALLRGFCLLCRHRPSGACAQTRQHAPLSQRPAVGSTTFESPVRWSSIWNLRKR